MWIADVEHCRRVDARAQSEFGVSIRTLMERAGAAAFAEIQQMVSGGSQVVFLCGKGNNGGDGFVAAALSAAAGYKVEILVAAEDGSLVGVPAEVCQIARSKAPTYFSDDPRFAARLACLSTSDLLVDALLGTGSKGEPRGTVAEAIMAMNKSGTPVLSLDVPSGIAADSGEELGESVWAKRTITLGLPKPFLFQGTGLEHSGSWDVADIGVPRELLAEPTQAQLTGCEWAAAILPERMRSSHKGDNGSLLIVAGSSNMPGAAAMAVQSALRAGAGLVTIASVEAVCRAVSNRIPECILHPLPEVDGVLSADAAHELLALGDRYDAAVFGPGLTQQDSVVVFLEQIWADWKLPSVIDADALNIVAKGVTLPSAECILTPHPAEMSRLLQASVAEVQADRFGAVRSTQQKFGKCTLLKGPYTVVADEDQHLAVNRSGNAGMATGGMGDVLSGILGTLLAQSIPAYHAAVSGTYWHGLAADICAQEIGPVGYRATEVADALPKARAKIVASCDYETCCSF